LFGISTSDTRYDDVWIVVPAFNEASVIAEVIADVRSVFRHVVCVDDGSSDDTSDRAFSAGAHVVRHPVNLGQGAAIQTGVEYARSRPDAEDLDIVVGTRFGDRVPEGMPKLRRLLFPIIAKVSPASRKLGLTDAHNGLRVFDKTVADGLNLTMSGMSHASEFVALIVENGWRVAEQPVEILYTEYSMSKGQPLVNGVNIIVDGLLRGRMRR
jgi:glycosyltransferase involved in cell wall biosynthesis